MQTQERKAEKFFAMHKEGDCFLVPNPWDVGSLRLLEWLGFEAFATTSAGVAFSNGVPDLSIDKARLMAHLAALCEATDAPITADLQNGFGDTPEAAAVAIQEAAAAGVVGASIEDASQTKPSGIYDIGLAKDRIRAAAEAARALPYRFTLTARAENYFCGVYDLADTIRRLQAFQEAGADVLFAPGVGTMDEIRAIVSSVDRPVNVLVGPTDSAVTLATLRNLGVRRVSVGGSLARAAYGALLRAGREMLIEGRFTYVNDAVDGRSLNAVFLNAASRRAS
jgi:2-methylisocitrate lyase-like PEP mutase family enzyme